MSEISFIKLIWILIPIVGVYVIYLKWSDDKITLPYSLARMFLQLILIGYVLTYIFNTKEFIYIIGILNIYSLSSKPTKEALDDYPNDQSKQPRTEFAIVAQRASSTFIILVLRVQESSFFNLFSTSKNCRFLC